MITYTRLGAPPPAKRPIKPDDLSVSADTDSVTFDERTHLSITLTTYSYGNNQTLLVWPGSDAKPHFAVSNVDFRLFPVFFTFDTSEVVCSAIIHSIEYSDFETVLSTMPGDPSEGGTLRDAIARLTGKGAFEYELASQDSSITESELDVLDLLHAYYMANHEDMAVNKARREAELLRELEEKERQAAEPRTDRVSYWREPS